MDKLDVALAGLDFAVARGFPSATPFKGDHTHEAYLELMEAAREGSKPALSEDIGSCNSHAFGYMSIHVVAAATTENSLT